MRTGRPTAELVVTGEERETLERWARRPKTAQALAQRARIVLACATGVTNTVVAARFGITRQMVGKWRARFVGRRLDGLLDEPRPGAPRRVEDDDVERVLTLYGVVSPPSQGKIYRYRTASGSILLTDTPR